MLRTSLALATLVTLTAVGHADPIEGEDGEHLAAAHAGAYLQVGAAVTSEQETYGIAGNLDGGYPLGHALYAHARVSGGGGENLAFYTASVTTQTLQARIGAEARPCIADGAARAMVGVDLGLASTTMNRADYMSAPGSTWTDSRAIAVGRLGLDVGSRHVRVRPEAEMGFTIPDDKHRLVDDLQLGLAVAYVW